MTTRIRTDTSGIPCSLDAYTAFLGFKKLGYECTFFQKYEDLVKIHHNIEEPIVSESKIINRRLEDLGIKYNVPKSPDEIAEIYGRLIWKTTIQFLKKKPELWPVSVQSLEAKSL